MRRPAPRKPAKALAKPAYFPPANVLTRVLPPALVGQREFEQFHFIGFDLSQADLAGRRFSECLFENCNLAGASLAGTSLQNVAFERCKLLGLQFTSCRDMLFDVHFDQCQLDYASFWGKTMLNTRFVGCSLQEADRLPGADFRTAQGVALDPEQNELKQARFALHSLPGLLGKYGLVVE